LRVEGLDCGVAVVKFQISASGFMKWGVEIKGLEFRVWGSGTGFRVWGPGFRVCGSGFMI